VDTVWLKRDVVDRKRRIVEDRMWRFSAKVPNANRGNGKTWKKEEAFYG
jgi:hypothetical protein